MLARLLAPAAHAASGPADARLFEVSLEHLVITPAQDGGHSAYEVLDVLRVRPVTASADAGDAFWVPLPPGYQNLRVLGGFREGSVRAGPDGLEGLVAWPPAEGDSATLAVAYQIGASAIAHPWSISRPFAVGTLLVMVHPDVPLAVAGAEDAGDVDLGGNRYRGFVRQGLGAGESVLLAPRRAVTAPGFPGGAWGVIGVVVLAAALGVAGTLAWQGRARRAREGQRQPPARTADQLVDAVLALDAEYGAGYLEEEAYHAQRVKLLREIARHRPGGGAAS